MASRKFKVPVNLVNLSSDPGSADEGDIYYNTTSDVIRVYANGAWADVAAGGGGGGISNVVEDTTPQLGGDLDAQGYNITNVEYISLDTTPATEPSAAGSIWWNADFETANLQLDSAVTLQVGQEHVVRVKNASASVAIPEMTVVMFAGATGDTVTVSPAISTSSYEPEYLVGITTEEIPADGFGFVTQFGFVNNVDTSGGAAFGSETWSLGDLLYSDSANPGYLTNVKPASPNWKFPIAAVTRVNASSGRILVRAIPVGHLHDLTDVEILSPTDNELLAYNSADGTWINQTYDEAGLNKVFYQASEPSSPAVGDVWVDSDSVATGGNSNFLITTNGTGFSSNETVTLDAGDYRVSATKNVAAFNLEGVTKDSGTLFYANQDDVLDINIKTVSSYIAKSTGTSSVTFYDIVYGNGVYVLVGSGGTVLTSTDLDTWTSRTSGTTDTILGVEYQNSTFVFITTTQTGVSTDDGASWTLYSSPSSGLYTIVSGAGKFVIGPNTLYSSSNGYTWTIEISSQGSLVGFANGNFISSRVGGTYSVSYSPDGLNWTTNTLTSNEVTQYYSVVHDGTNYIFPSGLGVRYTPDLINFTTVALSTDMTSPLYPLVIMDGVIHAFPSSGKGVLITSDFSEASEFSLNGVVFPSVQYSRLKSVNGNIVVFGTDRVFVYDSLQDPSNGRVILEKVVV